MRRGLPWPTEGISVAFRDTEEYSGPSAWVSERGKQQGPDREPVPATRGVIQI